VQVTATPVYEKQFSGNDGERFPPQKQGRIHMSTAFKGDVCPLRVRLDRQGSSASTMVEQRQGVHHQRVADEVQMLTSMAHAVRPPEPHGIDEVAIDRLSRFSADEASRAYEVQWSLVDDWSSVEPSSLPLLRVRQLRVATALSRL
jgi:hypothetical protein